jgi:Fe-S-cluster-containing hydrogenase component 2
VKVLKPRTSAAPPRIPAASVVEARATTLAAPASLVLAEGGEAAITCLRCPERPCSVFNDSELPTDVVGVRRAVCPVDAIRFDAESGELEISNDCFGCGLCVIRCPYGSLFLTDGKAAPGPLGLEYVNVTEDEFAAFTQATPFARETADTETEAEAIVATLDSLDQRPFYPLVASLFTALGLPMRLGNPGDTSNRFDGLILDPTESIPVEMKSPGESLQINVKSVQQALENKVGLDAREDALTTADTSSLAVGYLPPAARSDVLELVNDIDRVYGIRIGLLPLRTLYVWLLKAASGEQADTDSVRRLRGLP